MLHDAANFDRDLQMFREPPRQVNLAHLQFLRWLVEQGRLEGPPHSQPSGEFAHAGLGDFPSARRRVAVRR
jgi:hypothetical protein